MDGIFFVPIFAGVLIPLLLLLIQQSRRVERNKHRS